MSILSDTGEYDGKTGSLADPCFLIVHPKGILLWDTGGSNPGKEGWDHMPEKSGMDAPPLAGPAASSFAPFALLRVGDTDAIALKVKQEFAAKEETQTAKKTVPKSQFKVVKKAKAA